MGKTLDLNFTIRARGGKETAQTISLSADSVRRLSREISKTGDISRKSIGKSRGEFKLLSDQISQAKGLLIGFFSINAGLGLAKSILDVNREMEKLRTQLTSLEGSRGAGQAAFGFLQDFSQTAPFQLEQLTKTFIDLKNFGIEPTAEVMEAITNQASKLGGSQETLQGITLALGQAWAKGKLQGEEILQLVERGVPVYKLLSEATGKNAQQLQEMSSKGQLTRDVISQLITKMGEMASGSNTAQMDTLNGKISNLGDSWKRLQDTLLGNKSEGAIKNLTSGLGAALDYLTLKIDDSITSQIKKQALLVAEFNTSSEAYKKLKTLLGFNIDAEEKRLELLLKTRDAENKALESEKKRAELAKKRAKLLSKINQTESEYAKTRLKISKDVVKQLESEISLSIKKVSQYSDKIKSLLASQLSEEERTADEIRQIKRQSLSEQEQQADIVAQIYEIQQQAQRALIDGNQEEAQRLAEKSRALSSELEDSKKRIQIIKESSKITLAARDAEIQKIQQQKNAEAEHQEMLKRRLESTQKEIKKISDALNSVNGSASSLHSVLQSLSDPVKIKLSSNLDSTLKKAQQLKIELKSLFGERATLQSALSDVGGSAIAKGLTGFSTGGSFVVGGAGGTDSQTIAFKATPGERVTIETPAQQQSRGSVNNVFNITMNGVNNVKDFVNELEDYSRTNPLNINVGQFGVIGG